MQMLMNAVVYLSPVVITNNRVVSQHLVLCSPRLCLLQINFLLTFTFDRRNSSPWFSAVLLMFAGMFATSFLLCSSFHLSFCHWRTGPESLSSGSWMRWLSESLSTFEVTHWNSCYSRKGGNSRKCLYFPK